MHESHCVRFTHPHKPYAKPLVNFASLHFKPSTRVRNPKSNKIKKTLKGPFLFCGVGEDRTLRNDPVDHFSEGPACRGAPPTERKKPRP